MGGVKSIITFFLAYFNDKLLSKRRWI